MKQYKKDKKETFPQKILNYLQETSGELFILSAKIIFNPASLTKGMALYRDLPIRNFSSNFYNLKRSPYFQFKNNKYYLTPLGRKKIIKNIIKNKKEKWDHKWRCIIFDIPELNRRQRRFLRDELKWIGFKELQKSIWIYPYDIEKELQALLKLWKFDIGGDIRFLLVEKFDDVDLKNYFKLI